MNHCLHCKTRADTRSKLKYIACTSCKNFFICGTCFDLFIYPRIVNYKFVNSKFNPLLTPVQEYSFSEDEMLFWKITNHIIENKCPTCTCKGDIQLFFSFTSSCKNISFPQQTKCLRQYETIVNIQDIYKTLYVEFNTKKSAYFIQLLTDPHQSKSHYILNNKEDDFADYRSHNTLDQLFDLKNKNEHDSLIFDQYIVKNVLLKHSIYNEQDLLFFIHEARLLGLEKILNVFKQSSLSFILSKESEETTSANKQIQEMLLDYYKKELYIYSLQVNCPYCYTFYNLLFDNNVNHFITKRTYLVQHLKNKNYSCPCFGCKKNMNLQFQNKNKNNTRETETDDDNISIQLNILYENYFANLSSDEICAYYFHHPIYKECYDIVNDSQVAFWYIVKRLEFFYFQVWKRHGHHLFENKKKEEKKNKKNKQDTLFDLVFSNPNELTFFEWIILGFLGNFIYFDQETRIKITLKQQPTFQFMIQATVTTLHQTNKKISLMDIHNFSHLSSFKAFIHSI